MASESIVGLFRVRNCFDLLGFSTNEDLIYLTTEKVDKLEVNSPACPICSLDLVNKLALCIQDDGLIFKLKFKTTHVKTMRLMGIFLIADGVNGNGKPSGPGAVSSLPLSPLDSRRSGTGKGCNSIEPSSHSRESGFQSSTSLTSLEKAGHEHSPVSTLDGLETGVNDAAMMMREGGPMGGPVGSSQLSADSMVSLISGLSDSASNPLGSRRHSLTTLKQQQNGEEVGSRRSVIRRSARFSHQNRHQPTHSLISEELRSVTEDGKPFILAGVVSCAKKRDNLIQ